MVTMLQLDATISSSDFDAKGGCYTLDPESRICFLLACTRAATERPADAI